MVNVSWDHTRCQGKEKRGETSTYSFTRDRALFAALAAKGAALVDLHLLRLPRVGGVGGAGGAAADGRDRRTDTGAPLA